MPRKGLSDPCDSPGSKYRSTSAVAAVPAWTRVPVKPSQFNPTARFPSTSSGATSAACARPLASCEPSPSAEGSSSTETAAASCPGQVVLLLHAPPVAYLHSACTQPVVHQQFRRSNTPQYFFVGNTSPFCLHLLLPRHKMSPRVRERKEEKWIRLFRCPTAAKW